MGSSLNLPITHGIPVYASVSAFPSSGNFTGQQAVDASNVGNVYEWNGASWVLTASSSAPPATIGTIAQFSTGGGDTYLTSAGWLKCDGSTVSQSTYATLYSRLGLIKTFAANWTIPPRSNTVSYTSVATNGVGNLYVLTAAAGAIYSSTDLLTITSRTSGTASNLLGVTFGAGLFCAVGAGGVAITSTDGVTWNSRTSNTTSQLNSVSFINSTFVAVGNTGALVTSTDAITWSARTSGVTSNLLCAGYGNSIYVVGGLNNAIIKSSNLSAWTDVSPTTAGPNVNNMQGGVVYFNNKYYLPAAGGAIFTSTDAITWVFTFIGSNVSFVNITSVANGVMIIGTTAAAIYSSTDGVSFSLNSAGFYVPTGICIDSTRAVICGSSGGLQTCSGNTYSYNTGTSFVLPNLTSFANSSNSAPAQVLNGLTPYYIKAL